MAWVPAQDDMAWKRASTGRGSMPPQITSFEPHARQPDSFRKPRQGDLILFSQISSIRNEGRHEGAKGNADQQSTRRAQHWESVTQALDRVRQLARQRKEEKFTSLFYISVSRCFGRRSTNSRDRPHPAWTD